MEASKVTIKYTKDSYKGLTIAARHRLMEKRIMEYIADRGYHTPIKMIEFSNAVGVAEPTIRKRVDSLRGFIAWMEK